MESELLQPRKKPRQNRSKSTVDAILSATARVLVEQGYDNASTNRIAQVAGVSVGSLYQYFPNKQALVVALVEAHGQKMIAALDAAYAPSAVGKLETKLTAFVNAIFVAHALAPALQRELASASKVLRGGETAVFDRHAEKVVLAMLEGRSKSFQGDEAALVARLVRMVVQAAAEETNTGRVPAGEKELFRTETVRLLSSYLRAR